MLFELHNKKMGQLLGQSIDPIVEGYVTGYSFCLKVSFDVDYEREEKDFVL